MSCPGYRVSVVLGFPFAGRARGSQIENPAPSNLTWLLWISIDPRSGNIIPYPKEARYR